MTTPPPLSEGVRITLLFLNKSLNVAMCFRGKMRSSVLMLVVTTSKLCVNPLLKLESSCTII